MAQIKSHNGRTVAQIRATRPDEPDTWLTLTVTSDGRLLRKITTAYRSQGRTHYSNSNNKVIGKTDPARLASYDRDQTENYLRTVAGRMGYTVPKSE